MQHAAVVSEAFSGGYAFFPIKSWPLSKGKTHSAAPLRPGMHGSPVLGWGFAGDLLEDAIELRERLKTCGESNLAYAQAGVMQKNARLFKSCPGNVTTKLIPVTCLNFSLK